MLRRRKPNSSPSCSCQHPKQLNPQSNKCWSDPYISVTKKASQLFANPDILPHQPVALAIASEGPTLDDEMDARSLGVIVCLHGAGVGALIVDVHVVYLDAVLGLGVGEDDHAVVYRPLVIAGIEDGAAVQPCYPCDPVIHGTPEKEETEGHKCGGTTHSAYPGS